MSSTFRSAGLALAGGFLFALGGCDITEPTPIVEARVAHAAPGLGTAQVSLNGVPTWQIAPGDNTFFPLNPATLTYAFTIGADVATISASHDADINAIVLMNRDDPTAYHFRLERLLGQQRIMVINGDFTTSVPMTVEIVGPEQTYQDEIGPAETFTIDPGRSEFQLRVRPGGAEEFVDVEGFTLVEVNNGFLVLAPVPDSPEQPYTRILF
jgi:hypothetical protein